ncbi:hypothetical protein [Devosia sp. 2618]|uniref:hypothetical protein n=1 Tax=Devosia sp. 2618 TaxID=3156454 RepID=UPI0033992A8D
MAMPLSCIKLADPYDDLLLLPIMHIIASRFIAIRPVPQKSAAAFELAQSLSNSLPSFWTLSVGKF